MRGVARYVQFVRKGRSSSPTSTGSFGARIVRDRRIGSQAPESRVAHIPQVFDDEYLFSEGRCRWVWHLLREIATTPPCGVRCECR